MIILSAIVRGQRFLNCSISFVRFARHIFKLIREIKNIHTFQHIRTASPAPRLLLRLVEHLPALQFCFTFYFFSCSEIVHKFYDIIFVFKVFPLPLTFYR